MITGYSRKRAVIWTGSGAVLAAVCLLLVDLDNPPDILLFIGRFHPMVVHFPIGFLVLGGVLELISSHRPSWQISDAAILLVLGLSAASALLAVTVGLLLALGGGYDGGTIGWHKWLGLLVAVGSVGAVGLKWMTMEESYDGPRWRRVYHGALIGTVGLLLTTGHLGGTLTHGSGYLTRYLPGPVKQLTGLGGAAPADRTIVNVDSAVVFTDLVRPILNDRCVSCHNANKTKGELRLDDPEQIMKGGEDGGIIVSGQPAQSELVRRITLPLHHDDRMPPTEESPLTVEETELIRWWVATGASFDTTVADVRGEETPSSVQTALTRLARPGGEASRTGLYALDAAPPNGSAVEELRGRGFMLQQIARDAPFLEVRPPESSSLVDAEQLEALEPLYPQIAWLDLSGTTLTEDALSVVGRMEHLVRLHLENSSVSDRGLAYLSGLDHLEYLNLYGTAITDAGLEPLGELERLETVYLWQTSVTDRAVRQWTQQHRGVTISRGETLMTVDSTAASPDSTDHTDT